MIGLAWAVLTAVSPAGLAIDVRGDTQCPTPSQVGAALVGLVAPPNAPVAPDVVELTARGTSVSIRLSSAADEVIGERRLPESLPCEERARTAAVIIAAWEARLRAVAGPLVSPPPAAGAAPIPPPDSRLAAASTAPPATRPEAPFLPARRPPPIRIETSAAVLASVSAGGVAPAAVVQATLLRQDAAFALGIGALAVGEHSMTVASGRGVWRRLGGLIDLESRVKWPAIELHMHAGLALTALTIMGQSLPVTSGAVIFDPGVLAGLRLRLPRRRLSPWLDATAASWPRAHSVFVDGSSASAQLPGFEALLGLGLSFGPEP